MYKGLAQINKEMKKIQLKKDLVIYKNRYKWAIIIYNNMFNLPAYQINIELRLLVD